MYAWKCIHFFLLWMVDAMCQAVWSPCLTSLQGHTLTWMASWEEPFIPKLLCLRLVVYSDRHETREELNQEIIWVKMGKGLRGYFLQMINRHILKNARWHHQENAWHKPQWGIKSHCQDSRCQHLEVPRVDKMINTVGGILTGAAMFMLSEA